ncbi:hypothetical protein NZD89_04100 [Alicyclobacillus fastidiosus]|uniref:Glycosyltransferase 2-like domain-containing protein n=1 Tax=Alicyclobacillus fastidiosus TaxID=392011 RepID=A0ABY6ZI90_9BACL|nr:hypothetical protein [Alicyclobacillus fastidiosus]WAH42634.1 hypothetical protein NZD89_04100 [Alicyclobacillus fastidiosus]GMA64506.1 hypothetical protein GCM10025859_49460 [Alicyclobacillus fastidiosus]
MWALLLVAVFAVYGTLVLVWQLWAWLVLHHDQGKVVYFIVLTQNAERDIEMVLRRVHHKCLTLEYPTRVCVIDAGSTDLTIPIVERMARRGMPLDILSAPTMETALETAREYGEATGSVRCIYQLRQGQELTTIVC